jgi:hypothetical protein
VAGNGTNAKGDTPGQGRLCIESSSDVVGDVVGDVVDDVVGAGEIYIQSAVPSGAM